MFSPERRPFRGALHSVKRFMGRWRKCALPTLTYQNIDYTLDRIGNVLNYTNKVTMYETIRQLCKEAGICSTDYGVRYWIQRQSVI
jgi:hypothetical protein